MALTLALPFALFAVAAAFHASYAGYGIAPFDLGILLADTDRVLRGEVFGRDFLAPYGPGSYYVLAPILHLPRPQPVQRGVPCSRCSGRAWMSPPTCSRAG